MNISHNGLGELVTTFETSGNESIPAGKVIKIMDGCATTTGEGEGFVGVSVDDSRNKKIAVQVGGYVKVKYTGTADYGLQYVISASASSVEFCDSSTEGAVPVTVLYIDSANEIAGFII